MLLTNTIDEKPTFPKSKLDNGLPECTLRGWVRDEIKMRDLVDTIDYTPDETKNAQNCQRPATWQVGFHMAVIGEAGMQAP